ncbi:MAG: DUF2461 domain-containing protein [Bacteroidetes bacterium]|nr:DUF2461 domain-containing protein [Bacteroidota bacterium]
MNRLINFLEQLKLNNNKEWFEANKNTYLECKFNFEKIVQEIIIGISKFDKAILPTYDAKKCVFRIYKDVRFSKDKSPYKTNFGASINPGGKRSLIAGYYLHIEPNNSFIAGGVYMPIPEHLAAIRQEIDYNSSQLLKIFNSKGFKAFFNGFDEIDKLKSAPKNYDKNHPHIKLLKNKHFTFSSHLTNKMILNKNFVSNAIERYKSLYPALVYLRNAVEK